MLDLMKIKGIKNIKYIAKGHRGIVYAGLFKNNKVAIKVKRQDSQAVGRIENETFWLKKLNKHNIGPKLIKSTKKYFICYFVKGDFFVNLLEEHNKTRKEILKIIKDVLEQCFIMDKLKVDKKEMHHPLKHIIVTEKLKPVLIDFERCHHVSYGKNVTQFSDFLMRINDLLIKNNININREKMIILLKKYKKNQTKENFEKIMHEIQR